MFMLVPSSLLLTFISGDDVTCTAGNVEVPVVGDAVIFMEQISLIQKQGSDLNLQALSNGYQASM